MKNKTNFLFILLAFMVAAQTATAQVTNLGIAQTAGGRSVLYWPVSTTNYVLQTVTNLASTNWLTARTAFAVNAAEVTNAAPSGFFRLMPTTAPAGMALIPAGWFLMGDSIGDPDITDATPTNVYVSAFVMDVNLVDNEFWTNVYAYATNHGYSFSVNAGENISTGTNYPVVAVDWFDCVKWSNARSQREGLKPCYYTDAGFTLVFTNGDTGTTVYQNLAVNGYRLPTEAEWEKAARGGGIGLRFPWGNLIHTNQARYLSYPGYSYDLGPTSTPGSASPVGSFDVNGYGLYDMAGNEFQWCWDWYGASYGQPSPINPTGPASVGPGPPGARVFRGGNWGLQANVVQTAFRNGSIPGYTSYGVGFRCVRGL